MVCNVMRSLWWSSQQGNAPCHTTETTKEQCDIGSVKELNALTSLIQGGPTLQPTGLVLVTPPTGLCGYVLTGKSQN